MSFDTTSAEAVAWAEEHAAEMVTNITNDARDVIRALVVQGFEDGVAPKDLARLLRETIGLTERDALAVAKRRAKLLSDGLAPDVAQAKAEKYAAKLLRDRAENIARTETMRASNEGVAQLWKQAQEKGLLTGREMKVWITADPCPICAPLEGEMVGINEEFSVGQDPPLHPRCRCTIGIVMG